MHHLHPASTSAASSALTATLAIIRGRTSPGASSPTISYLVAASSIHHSNNRGAVSRGCPTNPQLRMNSMFGSGASDDMTALYSSSRKDSVRYWKAAVHTRGGKAVHKQTAVSDVWDGQRQQYGSGRGAVLPHGNAPTSSGTSRPLAVHPTRAPTLQQQAATQVLADWCSTRTTHDAT